MKVLTKSDRVSRAFTLLEVMIAIAIFFMVSFSILAVVSAGLRTAKALRTTRPSASILAAELSLVLSTTNKLDEGTETVDFGKTYPDFECRETFTEVGTNGLWQVDFEVYDKRNRRNVDSRMSALFYIPQVRNNSRLGVQPP